ncbi:MAG TPA: TauD/TfdA family dioxygenase [Longimicrobium sp.]|jgi:hypothetical protein|nr:TauD/TfdA family dioxygenase [Longimicrobium sp.]
MQSTLTDIGTIREAVQEQGFYYMEGAPPEFLDEVLAGLGTVIQTTDVSVKGEGARLVTSDQALDVHTDHYRADLITWHCVEQSDEGGVTVLVDAEVAYSTLSAGDQRALERIMLTEHRVFPDDPGSHPLVSVRNGRRKFYYSFWLVAEPQQAEEREALAAFRAALAQTPRRQIRLRPGDILVIDNGRMLHGRTAIGGNKQRLLKRFWIHAGPHATLRQQGDTMPTSTFVLPEPITPERISELVARGIDPNVAALDLSMVKMKLADPEEGKGWTPEQCEEAEVEYKRFLTLNLLYPRSIVPTTQMDTMWHYHILDTRAYHRDSERIFGGYFHHFPYFGMRGAEDEQNLANSFQNTGELYEKTFGEPIVRAGHSSCWHDCQSRCWHACSSKDKES